MVNINSYESIIKKIKEEKIPAPSKQVWSDIIHTIEQKDSGAAGWHHWLSSVSAHPLFSSAVAAAAVLLLVVGLNLYRVHSVYQYLNGYSLVFNSTEAYAKYNIWDN